MAEQNKIWSYSQTLSSFSYLWFCSPHIHMSTSYTLFIIFINPLSPFIVDHTVWCGGIHCCTNNLSVVKSPRTIFTPLTALSCQSLIGWG